MRRAAKKMRRCRRCPFCAPSGRCLERTIKSGRCGDWVWFMRGGKQRRRPYTRPNDPHTLAQLRSRGRLSAASKRYSFGMTDGQRKACIAAGARLRTRPRLAQSGPMTGQQYLISGEYARAGSQSKVTKTRTALQVLQPQKVKQSTWEPHRGTTGVAPDLPRPARGLGSVLHGCRFVRSRFPALPSAARAPGLCATGRGTPRILPYHIPRLAARISQTGYVVTNVGTLRRSCNSCNNVTM